MWCDVTCCESLDWRSRRVAVKCCGQSWFMSHVTVALQNDRDAIYLRFFLNTVCTPAGVHSPSSSKHCCCHFWNFLHWFKACGSLSFLAKFQNAARKEELVMVVLNDTWLVQHIGVRLGRKLRAKCQTPQTEDVVHTDCTHNIRKETKVTRITLYLHHQASFNIINIYY